MVFIVITWGFLISMFYRVSATVISTGLAADLSLSAMQLSTLSSAFFYAFAALQIPAGPALDRAGSRVIMVVLGLVAVGGALLFSASHSFHQALAARVLMGIGMACNLMGAYAILAAWFPAERFATMAGALTAVGTGGMVLAATPLAWIATSMGWRGAFVAVAAMNLVQIAAFVLFVRDRPQGAPRPTQNRPGLKGALEHLGYLWTKPWFWTISLAIFFRFGAFMSLQGLLAGPYLIYGHGLSPVQAGNVLMACSLGYIAGLPLSGQLSDVTLQSRKLVISPALILTALLFILLSRLGQGAAMPVYLALFFAIGIFSAPGNVAYAHIRELCPREMAGTAMTGINLFNMLGPAVLIQVGGAFMPENIANVSGPEDFGPVWLLFAAGLLASGLLYLALPDSRQRAAKA
jgi:MFS family permease